MADSKQKAAHLKDQGNSALSAGETTAAIDFYTQGIELDKTNHVLFSNRSAAYCKIGKYREALKDAEKVVTLNPDWGKGYSRQGTALLYLERCEEAKIVFEEGLKIDPENKQMKDGLKQAESKLTGPAGSQEVSNPFAAPNLVQKLENHPKTKEWMKEKEYRSLIEGLQKDPTDTKKLAHPKMLATMGALMGIDILNSDDFPGAMNGHNEENGKAAESTGWPEPEEDKKSSDSTKSLSESVKEAIEEKEKGNAAYKSKQFDQALEHYSKAIELDSTNITFYTNKAAVYFEQGNYDDCIKICESAVDIGRENRADYKLIAKAFSRMGNAYHKQKKYEDSLKYYNKSLSEHRDPEIGKKVNELKKLMKEQEELAYIDPAKSEEAKQQGNEFFKKGRFPEAMKHYDEAIRRNPKDHRLYSNRAACYTKLLDFNRALDDSNKCIELEPSFVKGYLRKATSLQGLHQYPKAIEAFEKAMELDPNVSEEAKLGIYKCRTGRSNLTPDERKATQGLADPEVQEILNDPVMQVILQQMQQNPEAAQEHLKNPQISAKFKKLMQAGLVDVRPRP